MRLWNPKLLQQLPMKDLSTLHMAICRIRGRDWGKPTSRTWYYNLSWSCLVWYHSMVIKELQLRGWRVCVRWLDYSYRGKGRELAEHYENERGRLQEFETLCPESLIRQEGALKRVLSVEKPKR